LTSPRAEGIEGLIETALGLQNLRETTRSSDRLEALIVGPADLAASLAFPPAVEAAGDSDRWHFVRMTVLVAARAAGLDAIDGPHLQVDDVDGLRTGAIRARELGFDGKWALHPSQIEPLNECFVPSAAELDRARAVLASLGEARRSSGAERRR